MVGVEPPRAWWQQSRVGVRAHVCGTPLLVTTQVEGGRGSVGDVGGGDDDLAKAATVVRASAKADVAAAHGYRRAAGEGAVGWKERVVACEVDKLIVEKADGVYGEVSRVERHLERLQAGFRRGGRDAA